MILNDQKFGLTVLQQLQMLGGSEFVVERHQYAAAIENRIRGNQPLRLIGHDDRGAIPGLEPGILQRTSQRQSNLFEIRVGKPSFFSIPVRLDQANFVWPTVQRIPQRSTEAAVLVEIEHQESAITIDAATRNCKCCCYKRA